MFAGHYPTLQNKQLEGFRSVLLFDSSSSSLSRARSLTTERWYPTALTLPSGEVYVPGGTQPQMPNGVWPKANGADIFSAAANSVRQVPLNSKLQAACLGNWYMGGLVLPSGQIAVMNKNMMQVVNPTRVQRLLMRHGCPTECVDLVWEYPNTGAQVHLRAPIMRPGQDTRLEFIVFGGGYADAKLNEELSRCSHIGCDRYAAQWRLCAGVSLRIGLRVTAAGGHAFDDAWQVEDMPAPRCMLSGVVLPNNHVVLLGGHKEGVGDLSDGPGYNGGNEPYDSVWIYNPSAPAGRRFSQPGARTRIARLYHATALLTRDGDVFVGGTSNARHFKGSSSFSRTTLGVNEYRNEIYHPPYLFQGSRPRITMQPPTFITYGGSFDLGYGLSAAGSITGVALQNAGAPTHNYAIGHRSQLLDFRATNATHGVLRVTSPAGPNHAPPGHYLLFLLRGDVYSRAAWVQLRKPLGQVPSELPQTAKLISQMSTTFEPGSRQPYTLGLARGRSARAAFKVTGARGSGVRGAHVSLIAGAPSTSAVVLQSEAVGLKAGQKCYMQLWARAGSRGVRMTLRMFRASAAGTASGGKLAVFRADQHRSDGAIAGEREVRLQRGGYCLHVLGTVEIRAGADYVVQLDFGLVQSGTSVDIDDVEVYCV